MDNKLELQSNPVNEIAEQKRAPWGQLGVSTAIIEQELIEAADKAIARLILPANIEDVPRAEQVLKNINAEKNAIEARRKEVTSRFDSIIGRLMLPEKKLGESVINYSKSIITIKEANEQAQKAVKAKNDEIVRIKEALVNEANKFDANCKLTISNYISSCYQYCLGEGNIGTIDKLSEAMVKMKAKFSVNDFIFNPAPINLSHLSDQEYADLVSEINLPTDYVALFLSDLAKQFANYEVDWHQKERAISLQKEETEKKAKEIEQEQKNKDIAAKLDTLSTVDPVQPGIKALKKSYQLDMPETMENAWKIMGAFIANKKLCEGKLRLKNAFNMSVSNMIVALEKTKNEDNVFHVEGLIWKEVSKL